MPKPFRTAARPVLQITRSNRHVTAKLIQRENTHRADTEIARASTAHTQPAAPTVLGAQSVGESLAQKAVSQDVQSVEWTKPYRCPYHGKLAAVVDALRSHGISIHSPGLQHKVPMRLQPHQHSVLLGHFPYSEAPASKLCAVGDTGVQLRRSAAEAFQRMRVAAYVDAGVVIFPVSGFRSAEEQHEVFVAGKAAAGQSTADRARVSAPPLHTEHSTGYAVDIGTDSVSEQLDESFETTLAFAWLQAHAHRFGFELSFQRGNAQGIAHEPWHWRYVGNAHAWWTFHPAIRI